MGENTVEIEEILETIDWIEKKKVNTLDALFRYRERLPTHEKEFDIPNVELMTTDTPFATIVCTHLLLKAIRANCRGTES